MVQAHVHLACAPHGAGLLYALLWFDHGSDVYGWFMGARGDAFPGAYFKLESYRRASGMRFLRSAQDDVYGAWVEATAQGETAVLHPPPVPEELCHELARLQDRFIRHWLFFADDPDDLDGAAQAEALRARGWPVRAVNVRADRLGKLDSGGPVWRYDAPGADLGLLVELSRLWPLDHRVES